MPKEDVERIHRIVTLIRQKGSVTRAFLLEDLEVSWATIKRDILCLRDRLDCPLVWDRGKSAYVIQDENMPGGMPFELPGLWFNSSEVYALLTMLELLHGVQPGLIESHIEPMKTKLRKLLGKTHHPAEAIEERVKLIHFANRKVEVKHFEVLAHALLDRKRLIIRYRNRDKKEVTDREVSPIKLVHYRENWLLDAWCHMRGGLRSFSLDAIVQVSMTKKRAQEVSHAELDEHFQSGYGIFAGKAKHNAKLKFTPDRAQYVALETWHPKQKSATLPDGSYVLEIPYSNDQELVMDLLRHGGDVEVMAPPELRTKVAATLRMAAEKYS